jgi:fatty acid desaturase
VTVAVETPLSYTALRRAITEAGLLDRAYGYYAWRTSVSFALLFAGIGLALVAPPAAVTFATAASLVAFGSVQVALIGHDAGHLAVFSSRRANAALGSACWSLSLGISFWYWSDRHTRHHTSTNDLAADPDLQWAGLVAYSESIATARPRRVSWLRRYQAVLGPLYTLFLPFAFRYEGWQFTLRRLRGRRRALEILLLLVGSAAWLGPALSLGWWWLAVFFASQTIAGLYLALAIAPNHKGMPVWPTGAHPSFVERQVLSSRNVTPNLAWDFVFGGLNYQIEHHLFPTMPRIHFSRARLYVKPFCAGNGLPYVELGAVPSYALVISELRRVGRTASGSGPA